MAHNLVTQDGCLPEGAALNVLSAQAHVHLLQQQTAKGQLLARGPVDAVVCRSDDVTWPSENRNNRLGGVLMFILRALSNATNHS